MHGGGHRRRRAVGGAPPGARGRGARDAPGRRLRPRLHVTPCFVGSLHTDRQVPGSGHTPGRPLGSPRWPSPDYTVSALTATRKPWSLGPSSHVRPPCQALGP